MLSRRRSARLASPAGTPANDHYERTYREHSQGYPNVDRQNPAERAGSLRRWRSRDGGQLVEMSRADYRRGASLGRRTGDSSQAK
jgi:hypothetical protein